MHFIQIVQQGLEFFLELKMGLDAEDLLAGPAAGQRGVKLLEVMHRYLYRRIGGHFRKGTEQRHPLSESLRPLREHVS